MMLQVPAPVAVTFPDASTVVIAVLSLLQAPAPKGPPRTIELAVNVVVALIHKGLLIPVTDAMLAIGLTVTVTVKGAPGQLGVPGAVGVTLYIAVWLMLVELTKLPVMAEELEPAAPPVITPVTEGADQL